MNTTSSQLPICVYCGTPRPADETLCPTCGKPWIDTTIQTKPASGATPPAVAPASDTDAEAGYDDGGADAGAVVAATAVAGVAASHHTSDEEAADEPDDPATTDSGESNTDNVDEAAQNVSPAVAADETDDPAATDSGGSDTEQPPTATPSSPAPFGTDDTGEFAFTEWTQPVDEQTEGRRTAWLVPAGIAAAVLAAVAFLVFGGNNAPSTTTVAAVDTTITAVTTTSTSVTTTTQATTTTAIVFPLPGDWPPKGEPIDVADLTLKQSAIGPIDIGMPIADAAGALTASLGEATASDIDGLCPPDESYRLQFGQLTAIFDGFDSSSVFVSYRYDEPQGTDPELGLKTLSGIAIGDTVEDLINTYTQFTISFEIIASKDFFRLSDGGELLLWGPISSADPAGLIEGIYSPTVCDTTP
jgi:hypothetical protein